MLLVQSINEKQQCDLLQAAADGGGGTKGDGGPTRSIKQDLALSLDANTWALGTRP